MFIRPSRFNWIAFAARHIQKMKHVDIEQYCGIHDYHHRYFERTADIFIVFLKSVCPKGFVYFRQRKRW